MKTFRELFEELDEPYRSQAIVNSEEYGFVLDEEYADTVQDAIVYGFSWRDTEEGCYYWSKLHESLSKHANI